MYNAMGFEIISSQRCIYMYVSVNYAHNVTEKRSLIWRRSIVKTNTKLHLIRSQIIRFNEHFLKMQIVYPRGHIAINVSVETSYG